MDARVSVVEAAPDPGWRPLELPGWDTAYLVWPPRADGEAGVPPSVAAALAEALSRCTTVVFLGGEGDRQAGEGWQEAGPSTWTTAAPVPWTLRRQGAGWRAGLVCSRDPAVVATLFEQEGFDWTQCGQVAFLLHLGARCGDIEPKAVFAAMKESPPHVLPDACIGLMRPGTDGDFAELTTRNPPLRSNILGLLARGAS